MRYLGVAAIVGVCLGLGGCASAEQDRANVRSTLERFGKLAARDDTKGACDMRSRPCRLPYPVWKTDCSFFRRDLAHLHVSEVSFVGNVATARVRIGPAFYGSTLYRSSSDDAVWEVGGTGPGIRETDPAQGRVRWARGYPGGGVLVNPAHPARYNRCRT